ncbi:MAG: TRAP transporter substrate-binding protein [Balneolaceae bacterium]
MRQISHFFLILLLLVLLSSCRADRDVTVLKLAHGLDVSHPVHQGMVYMADQVRERSNGKMTIDIYPSQQLGTEREALELLQIGSIDMTKVSSSVLEGFDRIYTIYSVPFLFESIEHAYRVWDSPVGRRLLHAGHNIRLHGLTYYDAGARSFYTKERPIRHPDDLQGMAIRVQESPAAIRMVNLMGGSATPISWGELYTSLQQGIVDGAENNLPSIYLSRHYEVVDYLSMNEHTAVPDILFISLFRWNRLSDQERSWLQAAADASARHQRKLWHASSEESLQGIRDAGIDVIYPDKVPFMEKMEPIYRDLEQDSVMGPLMNQIRELAP